MSIFERFCVRVLRDDLLHSGSVLGGNKARKMAILHRVRLPYSLLVSYGSAQSNAMAALAHYAHANAQTLVFFASRRAAECANLSYALKMRARVVFANDFTSQSEAQIDEKLQNLRDELLFAQLKYTTPKSPAPATPKSCAATAPAASVRFCGATPKSWDFSSFATPLADCACELAKSAKFINAPRKIYHPASLAKRFHKACSQSFFIPEGAAIYEARLGAQMQARSVRKLASECGFSPNLTAVFLPSGTGASAIFLASALKDFAVLSFSCVNDLATAQTALQLGVLPPLWLLKAIKKPRFGALCWEYFAAAARASELAGVEFELLYDAPALWHLNAYAAELARAGVRNIIYIHQGGALGNESMKMRYAAEAAKAAQKSAKREQNEQFKHF